MQEFIKVDESLSCELYVTINKQLRSREIHRVTAFMISIKTQRHGNTE
jgi:hypothetical protein